MTFQQVLDGVEILSQSGNPSVSGIEYDSRRVKPGNLFVAMRGETSDGNRYIDQVLAAGATAIVTDSADEQPRLRRGETFILRGGAAEADFLNRVSA